METVLLLDTETTGLDPVQDHVIEVAACLYDLKIGCPIESYASLIRHGSNPAERINKIPVAALVDAPRTAEVWPRVTRLAERADCIAAHRAEFDRGFVTASLQRVVAGGDHASWPDAPWACTKTDFAWPGGGQGDHLVQLALMYGLGVASAHRAMADVDIMARVLTRLHEMGNDLPQMFVRACRPKKKFLALVSYDNRQIAKDHGFLWDDKRREWYRFLPPEDAPALPFRVAEAQS